MSRETLIEDGIGCARAVVIEDGAAVEYHLELPGVRVDARMSARLLCREGSRAFVALGDGAEGEALVDPAPPGVAEGGLVMIELRREAIAEPGRARLARAAALPAGTAPRAGPALADRLRGPHVRVPAHGPDRLEQAGWSEALEEARTGRVAFPGGGLILTRTPAFLAVDVDGTLAPAELAPAAAHALAAAIRRFGIGGAVVVDFPGLADRAARTALGDTLDRCLPAPFERTAMNGFGLVQIVRPKLRPSLLDHMQGDPAAMGALAALRHAERDPGRGPLALDLLSGPRAWIQARPQLIAELTRRTGRPVALADPRPRPISPA